MSVIEARLRPATESEVAYAKGGLLWKSVNVPWNFAMKILGTWELYSRRVNFLVMNTPKPLQLAHSIKHYTGFAPERGFIRTVPSFISTWNLIESETKVAEEFFKHERIGDLFEGTETMVAIRNIISKAFPEAVIGNEDFILTCSGTQNKIYHNLVLRLITGLHLRNASETIREEAMQTLKAWETKCQAGEVINATLESRLYASRVISRLVFGMPKGDEDIASSINFINYYIVRTIMRMVTKEDQAKFEQALKVFNKAITEVLNSGHSIPLFEGDHLTPPQKLAMVFTIFFAGQETVGSLLSYILWTLAKDGDLRRKLQEECDRVAPADRETQRIAAIQELFVRAIKEFPPAYGVTRTLKENVCLEFRLKGEADVHKHILYKGERLGVMMSKFAQNAPPAVEGDIPSYNAWFPFGGGVHRCPGENLAKLEIYEFLVALISRYNITTQQMHEIEKVGAVTLQLKEDVLVTVASRAPAAST